MAAKNVNIYIPKGKTTYYANFRVKERDPKTPAIVRTKQVNRCTGSPDPRTAQSIANGMRDKALRGLFNTVPKLRDDSPTCGKLVDTYLAARLIRTANTVAREFLNVVAEGSGLQKDRKKARDIRVNELSADIMQAFRDGTGWPDDDPKMPDRDPSTVNSVMGTAKSIFSARAMEHYRALHLDKAAIDSFKSVPDLPEKLDKRYRRIDPITLKKMDAKASMMLRLARWHGEPRPHYAGQYATRSRINGAIMSGVRWRNAFGTYWLIRRCGLRNVEVENLVWDWIEQRDDHRVISLVARENWEPKGSPGDVPIADDLYQLLLDTFTADGKPVRGGYVLQGTPTDRFVGANHAVSGYVRRFLPDRVKAVYELRKQWGSEVAMKYGIEIASRLLRHADLQTTMDHYYDNLKFKDVKAL